MGLELSSPVFSEGEAIPRKYTCDGPDVSPPLRWHGTPEEARALALICDDPDAPAGTWVHWVAYGIPASVVGLPEAVPTDPLTEDGWAQGRNDFKRIGYGGPCPPAGGPHRYFFKLYALDTEPDLEPGATKGELLAAMEGHVLAEARLLGTYARGG